MDDKKIDDLLHRMKDDYERIPEYVDNRTIMNHVLNRNRKPSKRSIIPVFAIIAGMLLFLLIALPYVTDFEQADKDTNYLEMYYLKKKEEFRGELGIESVDSFTINEDAELILKEYGSSADAEEIEQAKAGIDELFTTPKQMMKEINEGKSPVDVEALDRLLVNMNNLLHNFNEYYRKLLIDYEITIDKQKHILNSLDQPENYTGPEEIAEFLVMLKEQGFLVTGDNDGINFLYVKINYKWLSDNINNWEGHEGLKDFLGMLENQVDAYIPGVGNRHEIPWTEFDEILLNLEELIETYPEEREFLVEETAIYSIMNKYLDDYLAGGVDTLSIAREEQLDGAAQQELKSFVKNHGESRFHPIVKGAVNKYENESDWTRVREIFIVDYGVLPILFDERFQEISFKSIELVNRWPISEFTYEQFHDYQEEKSHVLLEKLSEFEILSLYMYAHDNRDADLYGTLYSKESEWREKDTEKLVKASEQEKLDFYWSEIIYGPGAIYIIKREKDNENLINYMFVDNLVNPVEITASIQLIKEGGIWKVLDRTIK